MRTDLDHLPPAKQRELEHIVQVLFEEFAEAISAATGPRKAGRIVKIILYGSHARGGWVEEPHTAKGYRSDFDLLVIVNQSDLTDRTSYWAKADDRLMREVAITGTLRTPVNFIVHSLQQVNDGLAHGRFFFIDVKQDGIALYQSDDRVWAPTARSQLRVIIDTVKDGISYPRVDRGFPPAGAAYADLDVKGKAAAAHFAIQGRAAETGPLQNVAEA